LFGVQLQVLRVYGNAHRDSYETAASIDRAPLSGSLPV
jgi:hypothetical protein